MKVINNIKINRNQSQIILTDLFKNIRQKYTAIFDRYDFHNSDNKICFLNLKNEEDVLLKESFYIDGLKYSALIGSLSPYDKIVFTAIISVSEDDPDKLIFNDFEWSYNHVALSGINDDFQGLRKA